MNYLTALAKLMKTSFKRPWHLLIILHPLTTNALKVHHKTGLMLKSWKKLMRGISYSKNSNVDKDNNKEARNEVQKLIRTKKKVHSERKLTEKIGKPKELWKSLESLGLEVERSISNINCLENDKSAKDIAEDFSAYFSNFSNFPILQINMLRFQ